MTSRIPMIEIDWFKSCGTLAIADVVYVEGIGLCSHQPDGRVAYIQFPKRHRVMDYLKYYYAVETDRLFEASQDERRLYWESLDAN